MYTMTLHAQADLWQQGTATFAALFMESDMRSPDNKVDRSDVLLDAVMNRGLRLAADLSRLALDPRRGWAVHLNPAGALTLTWCCSSSATASACATTPKASRPAPANNHYRPPSAGIWPPERSPTRPHSENPVQYAKPTPSPEAEHR
jgi:hypothetical protein